MHTLMSCLLMAAAGLAEARAAEPDLLPRKNWQAKLGERDFAGLIEFQARFRDGHGGMTAVSASKLRK